MSETAQKLRGIPTARVLVLLAGFGLGCSDGPPGLGTGDAAGGDGANGSADRTDAGPVDAEAPEPSWASVRAIGNGNTCGILDTGDVRCWGQERSTSWGEPLYLGPPRPGSSAFELPMTDVAGTPGMVCGLSRDDRIYCWGNEALSHPELGTIKVVPEVTGEPAVALTMSSRTVCWIEDDGVGRCQPRPEPDATALSEAAIPTEARFSRIALGLRFGCGLEAESGAVRCWGPDADRVVGFEPVGEFIDLAVTIDTACVVDTDQQLRCWGTRMLIPSELGVQEPVTEVEARGTGYCVRVASSGRWVCWNPSSSGDELASEVPDRTDIEDVSVTSTHACGRSADGWLCWGSNEHGQLDIQDPSTFDE